MKLKIVELATIFFPLLVCNHALIICLYSSFSLLPTLYNILILNTLHLVWCAMSLKKLPCDFCAKIDIFARMGRYDVELR